MATAPTSTLPASLTLPVFSAYGDTPIHNDGKAIFFGLLRDSVIPDPTDQLYTVTQPAQGRLDLVSALFYGTPQLWWVIALVNNVNDPLLGAAQGTRLRVPTKERLSEAGILISS